MALKCSADTPTYRGYETYIGYYSAMTADHWTHLNQAGGSAKTCPSFPDMCLSTGTNLSALGDNSTYESTIFGDRSVALIEAHDAASPFFLYLAFHNEHDPHQAPLASVRSFPHIQDDTYKVTATYFDGWRNDALLIIGGDEADRKAQRSTAQRLPHMAGGQDLPLMASTQRLPHTAGAAHG